MKLLSLLLQKCITLNLLLTSVKNVAFRSLPKLSEANCILCLEVGQSDRRRLQLIIAARSSMCRLSISDSISELLPTEP